MKHEYSKPTIELKNWFVNSDHIKRLYEFFQKRFSKSEAEITLETQSGHTRIYETLDEYLEDLPKLSADSEVVSKIHMSGSRRTGEDFEMSNYRQAWIDISFGKNGIARIHVIGGDTDESNKDWVEGAYNEALKLKKIFEVDDSTFVNHLGHNNAIVFDPDGSKFKALIKSLQPKFEKPQKVEVVNNQVHWYQTWWGQLIILVVGAGFIFLLGWN